MLKEFGNRQIRAIEDVTDFVKEQGRIVETGNLDNLLLPVETIYIPRKESLFNSLALDLVS